MTRNSRYSTLILPVLLLVTTLVYLNGLSNPFVIDDRIIIFDNLSRQESWTLKDFFRQSLFGARPPQDAYFRPVTLLTFAANYYLAKEKPQGYRATNIGLHLLVIVLTYLLFSRLADVWVALCSALLFALHPTHVQAVSYISSRSDLIYTILGLLCLLSWHRSRKAEGIRKALYRGSGLFAFFLGLFAKETMIVVPALIGIMDLTSEEPKSWREKIRENIPGYLGFVLLFFLYIHIRLASGFPLSMEGDMQIGLKSRLLLAPKIFFLYLTIIFYPVHLSLFRSVVVPQAFEWQVITGGLLIGAMVILAYLFWSTRREVSFGILWFLISMVPNLNLTLLNAPIMEHWLYLPSIGLSLALVALLRILAERVSEIRGITIGIVLIAILLSVRTMTRNGEWSDHVKLFSRDVSSSPRDFLAWFWFAHALMERGMLSDALRAYKTGLSINPSHLGLRIGLAEILSLTGKEEEAEEAFSAALSLQPQSPLTLYMLGLHRLVAGKNQEAIEPLTRSLELKPSAGAYHAVGSAKLRLGLKDEAEEAFQKAMRIHPGNERFHGDLHVHLGKLFLRQGKKREAQQEWQLALRFDPNSSEAKNLIGE